jgi:hypothetical protein
MMEEQVMEKLMKVALIIMPVGFFLIIIMLNTAPPPLEQRVNEPDCPHFDTPDDMTRRE